MPPKPIQFKCLEVTQPIGTFYVGSVPAEDVLAIAYADVRRIELRDIEKVVGIQRELSPKRVKELNQYVHNVDATFPTSVILAVTSDDVEYDPRTQTMTVRRDEKVARIIDGQHRIAGLENFGVFRLLRGFPGGLAPQTPQDFQGMAQAFNGWGRERLSWQREPPGQRRVIDAPFDPVIPCRVASPQSPTPFRRIEVTIGE